MARLLDRELKQRTPIGDDAQYTVVNIQRAAAVVDEAIAAALKPLDLTIAKFNVLCILRGAEPEALPSQEIGVRMVRRLPDVTRLVDGLVQRGLATRARGTEDRRVVEVRITAKGRRLVDRARNAVNPVTARLVPLSAKDARTLNRLLEQLRTAS